MDSILAWLSSTTGIITTVTAFMVAILLFIENSKKLVFKPLTRIGSFLFGWLHKKDHERMDKLEDTMVEFMKASAESDERIIAMIESMHESIDTNEKDRIRNAVFAYGRIARAHGHITTEEWRYLQDLYYKYHNELNGNGQVTEEYEFIKGYYYSQFENGKTVEE